MAIINEKPFPRGGNRPAFRKSKTTSFSLFGKSKKKTKKKTNKIKGKKQKPESNNFVEKFAPLCVKFVEELNYSGVKEGTLLLGIVSQVTEKILSVSLPGSLRGVVTLANISDFFKSLLQDTRPESEVVSLKEIFEPGDVLPFKVISVSDKDSSLMLTCDPKLINSKLTYDVLEKGLVLCGNVKSKEDHGFIIDFGIQQAHGFLNFKKVKGPKEPKVGQIVRCAIIDCNKTSGSCSLQVSTLDKDFNSAYIALGSNFPFLFYLPGFQFEVSVKKVLKNGVEVDYGGGGSSFKGYIHEEQLPNKFPKLEEVDVGTRFVATLLYVKSLVNIPYFKVMPKMKTDWPFQYGEIVEGKVVRVRRNGLIVRVVDGERKAKCFIPVSKLQGAKKLLESETSLDALFPVDTKLNQIRLSQMNYMARHYMGATDKASIEEKYYAVTDLKCGEIVTGTISGFTENEAQVLIGKTIKGLVGFSDMTDVPVKNPLSKFKIGQEVKARVTEISPETKYVRLTMKPTLLKEKKILTDHKFNRKKTYMGVVRKVLPGKMIVKFFNGVTGVLPKHFTPYPDAGSLLEYFSDGQLVKCYVLKVDKDNRLSLSMLSNDMVSLKVGQKYSATIVNKSQKAFLVDVRIKNKKTCTGYLPRELLTMHKSLTESFFDTCEVGQKLTLYCVSNDVKFGLPVMGRLEIFDDFFKEMSEEHWSNSVSVGSTLPFLYKARNMKLDRDFLYSLVPGKNDFSVRVVRDDFHANGLSNAPKFKKYELIYAKIVNLNVDKVDVSTKVSDIWEKDYNVSIDFLNSYLNAVAELVSQQKNKSETYSERAALGKLVAGTIEDVRTNHAIVRTDDGDLGLAEGKFAAGQRINGTIVWIDPTQQLIHVAVNYGLSSETNGPESVEVSKLKNTKLYAKVTYINDNVVVLQLKGRGRGRLAFMPRKRHLNDVETTELPFSTGDHVLVRIVRTDSDHILVMDNSVVNLQKKQRLKESEKKLKESIVSLKRKLETEKLERSEKKRKESESEELEVIEAKIRATNDGDTLPHVKIKQETDLDEDGVRYATPSYNEVPRLEYDDVEVKSEIEDDNDTTKSKLQNDEKIALSSSSESEDEEDEIEKEKDERSKSFEVGFNWEVLNDKSLLSGGLLNKDTDSSSDDEEEQTRNEKKKRRKLTESEKLDKSKTDEQRLRLIEERLMDPDREPETVDDFDRAVLSNPDSSALWLKYMAFHVQGTEIEEARNVARRALKAISFREEQEKLNVWIALLNLENLYGSEESLGKTLTEALQYNETYKIHIHMLNMYGKSNKLQDMEKLGNFMLKKYKDVENMWLEVGTAYYHVGKVESARLVLQRALTILGKKQHVTLVSQFAQLENKYGSPERAQTLYETILGSYPKRVDIWSCYVDMLVKSKYIDLARQVLERATSQSLRPRKMKTLFKKFLAFEEVHGSPENVEKVRESAVEYVQTVGSLHGV